jgi:hypothetical protein
VITLIACDDEPLSGNTCGTSFPATPSSGCVYQDCETQNETCSGASDYYMCTPVSYSASCSREQGTLYWNSEGQGFCFYPVSPLADVPAPCQTTQSVGPGCT